ncbi:unnamed protein product [Soboliphyme baturini]|uniref:Uncharacterized protein n=1 Tax=Soboliphyme baturini TaxID=241478 RepID=A0A3P8I6T9_9BILA|nr:unnamed protein product [Soboliphyme baturini]
MLSSYHIIRPESVSIILKNGSFETVSVNPVSILVRRRGAVSAEFDIAVLKVSRSTLKPSVFKFPVSLATAAQETHIGLTCETLMSQAGQPLFCPMTDAGQVGMQKTVLAGISSGHNCEGELRFINLYMKAAVHIDWAKKAVNVLDNVKPGAYSLTEDRRLYDLKEKEKPPSCRWPSDFIDGRDNAPADGSLLDVHSHGIVGFGVYVKVDNFTKHEHIVVAPAHLFKR